MDRQTLLRRGGRAGVNDAPCLRHFSTSGQTRERFVDYDVQRSSDDQQLLSRERTETNNTKLAPATMKVLLLALSASSVAAFAPNTFGVRCTFLLYAV